MNFPRALQPVRQAWKGACKPARKTVLYRNGYCTACETSSPPATLPSKSTAARSLPTPPADHRHLAIEQELFTTSIYSPGSPLFLPNGTRMFNKLTNLLRTLYGTFGFQEVITPTIYKKSLWEKSGHWENYAADMYSVTGRGAQGEKEGAQAGEDEEYGLKPMNCPGHCLIFASKPRSYRDLPIRYADFSPLHRNEISGALSGLTRVRRFHQDDGHIFCRPSQIAEEISKSLEFIKVVYGLLGLGSYRLALSTRPSDQFIGSAEEWDNAEAALRQSLDASGQVWTLNEGDGAFYGPKIDIILKDSDGKEHQTATIQLDFQLPKRFELEYQAPAPRLEQKGLSTEDSSLLDESGSVTPVMIHRAVLGSVERIMALLIEHYNGRWPLWLSPRQVMILTVNDNPELVNYARTVAKYIERGQEVRTLQGDEGAEVPEFTVPIGGSLLEDIAVEIDDSSRSLSKKISEAKRKRYSVIVVVGKRDLEGKTLSADFSGLRDQDAVSNDPRIRYLSATRKAEAQSETLESFDSIDHATLAKLFPKELTSVTMDSKWLRTILSDLARRYK